jgi:hypothetical protein
MRVRAARSDNLGKVLISISWDVPKTPGEAIGYCTSRSYRERLSTGVPKVILNCHFGGDHVVTKIRGRTMAGKQRVVNMTKRAVDAAKPEAARYIIWDAGLGFGLRVAA